MRFQPYRALARLTATSAVLLFVASSQVHAGIFLSANYLVSHDFHPSGVSGGLEDGGQAGGGGVLQASLSFDGSIELASATAFAQGGLIDPGNQLRLKTFANGSADSFAFPGGEPSGFSVAIASSYALWNDSFSVRDLSGASVTSAVLVANLEGTLFSVGLAEASVNGTLSGSDGTNGISVQRDSPGVLTLEVNSDANGSFAWSISVSSHTTATSDPFPSSDVYQSLHSQGISDFSHSMTLSALLVRDSNGNLVTPESLGYTLSFDSGMGSPNLQSVPEPSSVALTLLGAAALGGWGWRRRRGLPLAEV